MFKKIMSKFVWYIHDLCDNYIYNHEYIPKHSDKDFWEDDFR